MDDQAIERFWGCVERGEGCWRWKQRLTGNGYGQFSVSGRAIYAHRVAYVLNGGVIPDGYVIDHLCRNRWCVNPVHLEPVTQRENARRGIRPKSGATRRNILPLGRATATHCGRGHEWNTRTTYLSPSGTRNCRLCANALRRARYHASRNVGET